VPPTFDYVEAIARHSAGFADAADGNLDAGVRHCPDWSVADLVWHLTEVHWFWGTIADERLAAPPPEDRRPPRPPDDRLIASFRTGAARLVDVLRRADDAAEVWTWAPAQRDVAFITRHQVQEAAVHHWDAADAAGRAVTIEPAVAADSVAEFLTFSVSSEVDPAEPARPPLGGEFALVCTDAAAGWTVSDGKLPGTVTFEPSAREGVPTLSATASDLLLWLYRRVDLPISGELTDLIERFRTLTFTD
jgi:uncharacterized protein (TIGR03083 family)